MSPDTYVPRPEHKFSFGLWTVSNRGRDPFGSEVRPPLPPVDAVKLLAEVGAWGLRREPREAWAAACAVILAVT